MREKKKKKMERRREERRRNREARKKRMKRGVRRGHGCREKTISEARKDTIDA